MSIDVKKKQLRDYEQKLGRARHYLKSGFDGYFKVVQIENYEREVKRLRKEIKELAEKELNRLRNLARINQIEMPEYSWLSREGLPMSQEQANYFDEMKRLVKEMGDDEKV